MSNRKHRRRLLGLLVVTALGVMAFAASAQAVTNSFTIGGKAAALLATVTGSQEGVGTLSIPALNLALNCTGFTVLAGTQIHSFDDAVANLRFEGCTLLEATAPFAELAGCEIVLSHTLPGLQNHIPAAALLLPAELNNGSPAILVEKIVASILTHENLGCLLPKTTVFKGEACFKVTAGNDTVEQLIQSSQTIQGECKPKLALEQLGEAGGVVKDKLLFGAQEAFFTIAAKLKLTGPHAGMTLGVLLV